MENQSILYFKSICENAVVFHRFFVDSFKECLKQYKDKHFKLKKELDGYLLTECLIYSFMVHETSTFLTFVKVRDEVTNLVFGDTGFSVINNVYKRLFKDSKEFNDFMWKRYTEYSTIFQKKDQCNLLYYPLFFKKEDYDSGLACMALRFNGIIIRMLFGGYDSIPSIEPGPLFLTGIMFDVAYSELFITFCRLVGEAVEDFRPKFERN